VLAAGYDLMVYDLRPEALEPLRALGAKVASTPSELGRHADLIEVSIAGDDRIETALLASDGVLSGMAPGSVIALHSTMHPAMVRTIAAGAEPAGVSVIDAQVSGGAKGAKAQTLCYMIGGDAAVVERCRPVFATSGTSIFHMGPLGAGASSKLAQQMMTVMNIVAVAEGLNVATAAGVDVDRFLELLEVSTGQSYASTHWLDEFSLTVPVQAEGFYIGLRPAIDMAHDLNVPVPACVLAQQLIMALQDRRLPES
jgi:3-hydroxyisobutyrate dehydrogenase